MKLGNLRRRSSSDDGAPNSSHRFQSRRNERRPRKQGLWFDEGKGLSTKEQQYDPTSIINEVRADVDSWRSLVNPNQWQVTPETARLLQHWRQHQFGGVRPFFCQVEAAETAICLAEVAPQSTRGKRVVTLRHAWGFLLTFSPNENPARFPLGGLSRACRLDGVHEREVAHGPWKQGPLGIAGATKKEWRRRQIDDAA
jgi:hypothetical protein